MSCQDPLSPGDSHVLLHAAAPSHLSLLSPLKPQALGVLSESPAQGESRIKSFLIFSLHKREMVNESDGKSLFFSSTAQEGSR